MNANEPKNLPKDFLQARNRFQTRRSQRPIGSPIPDSLWDLAVKLAGQHGLSFRASVLQLDHYDLKNRTQEDRPQIPSRESFFCNISAEFSNFGG